MFLIRFLISIKEIKLLTTTKIKKFEFGLLCVSSMKTITICPFYTNLFFVVGITVMLLFVITVWCSIVL